jgi:DNA-binding NarL/FixJ family response regulator
MSADPPIRVVVADDHPVVREGLRSFLATRPGIEVVGEAEDAASTLAVTEELRPDVVLVDLMMPGGGIAAIEAITALDVAARCLVLTSFTGDNQVIPALRAGAAGYLLKDAATGELELALRTVIRGESWLSLRLLG